MRESNQAGQRPVADPGIRPATAADQAAITRLVRSSGINPFSLHWQRFLVAEEDGRIVGVAQIKPHGDGSRELASLAVAPDRQGTGIGGALVRAWLSLEDGPLYLTCRDRLEGYYRRFGFRKIGRDEMPPYFRRLMRLAGAFTWLTALSGEPRRPLVMRREVGGARGSSA